MDAIEFGKLEQGWTVRCERADGAVLVGAIVGMFSYKVGMVARLAIRPSAEEGAPRGVWSTMILADGTMAYKADLSTLSTLFRVTGVVCLGCGAPTDAECTCGKGSVAPPCSKCGSEDTEALEAPSMHSGTDHGVKCLKCGREEWAMGYVK
jgi:hypothetical protein